jgi:hypothetical protein
LKKTVRTKNKQSTRTPYASAQTCVLSHISGEGI